jgi:hypothetical protein
MGQHNGIRTYDPSVGRFHSAALVIIWQCADVFVRFIIFFEDISISQMQPIILFILIYYTKIISIHFTFYDILLCFAFIHFFCLRLRR